MPETPFPEARGNAVSRDDCALSELWVNDSEVPERMGFASVAHCKIQLGRVVRRERKF